MKLSVIPLLLVVLSGCVSMKDYVASEARAAAMEARLDAATDARIERRDAEYERQETIRLYIEQMQNQEGRRPHRPSGG